MSFIVVVVMSISPLPYNLGSPFLVHTLVVVGTCQSGLIHTLIVEGTCQSGTCYLYHDPIFTVY